MGARLAGGDALQTAASSAPRELQSSARSCARSVLDGSVATSCSVAKLNVPPKPHANTVTPSSLRSTAESTTVWNSVLPGAASTVCSPSETSSTILVAPTRPSSSNSCRAASKPSEIEVLPSADIWSIPAWITAALYDHGTRVVAFAAKDTTEKRAAPAPREYWFTSCLAKAFIPTGPSIEPSGTGFFIEPLSSSTRAKSIGDAQDGLGGSGGSGGREACDRTRLPADVAIFTSSSPRAAALVDPVSCGTCDVYREGGVCCIMRGAMCDGPCPCVRVCVCASAPAPSSSLTPGTSASIAAGKKSPGRDRASSSCVKKCRNWVSPRDRWGIGLKARLGLGVE